MSQPTGFADKVAFVWGVADLLRGDFKAHEYGQVILPLVVLRRLECALEPTKAQVVEKAYALQANPAIDPLLRQMSGHSFYNISRLDLTKILNDPGNAAANLRTYLAGFSPSAREVLDAYGFDSRITKLDQAGLLYQVLSKFADLDLRESTVSNDAMGYIFEELLRRFSEMSNETAGEHFTPREVIRLMVEILFAEDTSALTGTKPVRTLYDPACGTGGMLTVASEHLRRLNPSAVLGVYGQELNAETWAICRSELMIKGEDPDRVKLGNSLTDDDGHRGLKADYMLANPPFGVDWKKYADAIQTERDTRGLHGRYGAGLPRVSDGSLLFLQHMLSKMKPVGADGSGGTRLAIVFSGSPLFAGAAGGGESEIRKWILDNDWLEGIVALPDQLFYNTGISTYFWVLTNRKTPDRRGKVALIDARESFTKMRKSLGDKRKFLPDDAIAEVTRLYHDAIELAAGEGGGDKRVKVFDREAFGYQRITVERPLRRVWQLSADAVEELAHSKAWIAWATPPKGHDDPATYVHAVEQDQALAHKHLLALTALASRGTEKEFAEEVASALGTCASPLAAVTKAVVAAGAVAAEDAPVIRDKKGDPLPDPDLRDAENVPLPTGWFSLGEDEQAKALQASAEVHLATEIHPYAPDAWIDHTKTKVGVEIPFTRHFYEYVPPRSLTDIDAELLATEERIRELLSGLVR